MGIGSTLKNIFNIDSKNHKRSSKAVQKFARTNKQQKLINSSTMTNSPIKSPVIAPSNPTSSSSNGQNFKYEGGRRYHADESVAYVLPNDDDEADRVHEQHWILRHGLQGNFFSPITKELEEGITVLDSGCGPATWAFEMGEAYPRSKFHGVDVSCVFPEDIKPSNVEFSIANIAKELPFEDNYFDYIHQRLLILGLTSDDWTKTLSNLYRVLKPGGSIEIAEPDFEKVMNAGPGQFALQSAARNMSNARGLPPRIATELEERITKAGFVDVKVSVKEIPINHGGKIGELYWADYKRGYLTLRSVLAKLNPAWEDEATYQALIDQCGEEAKSSKACIDWYSVQAKKP